MGKPSETRTYTDNGLLETITDARGNTTEYEYDGFDRLKKRIYPDSKFEEYTYNANNQILTFTTTNGYTTTNTYDPLSRLQTKQPQTLPLQTMTYDLAGRLLKLNTPSTTDPTSGDYEWAYDTAGRLLTQKMPDAREVTYELDENGNKIKLVWPDGYFAEYFFDELNRLTDIKLNGDTDPAVHFDFDALNRRTLLTYENGCSCIYSWEINDDLDSLSHTFTGSSVTWNFSYNRVHQALTQSIDNADYAWGSPSNFRRTKYGTANNMNQYTSVNGLLYGYDNQNNNTFGTIAANFDEFNRMTDAYLAIGSPTVDFIYDPLNRQAQKSVSSVDTGFLHDGVQLIAEYDGSTLERRYIPGILPDEVLIKIESSTKTYFHKDRLGSVIAVTDDTGAALSTFKYGPFGETAELTGTPFGYTGQRFDQELQAYYYKARYYSPAIGRFLQPDPLGFDAGQMNFYSYVGNDATNWTDPTGLVGKSLLSNLNKLWQALGDMLTPPAYGENVWDLQSKPNESRRINKGGPGVTNYEWYTDNGLPLKPWSPQTGDPNRPISEPFPSRWAHKGESANPNSRVDLTPTFNPKLYDGRMEHAPLPWLPGVTPAGKVNDMILPSQHNPPYIQNQADMLNPFMPNSQKGALQINLFPSESL